MAHGCSIILIKEIADRSRWIYETISRPRLRYYYNYILVYSTALLHIIYNVDEPSKHSGFRREVNTKITGVIILPKQKKNKKKYH